LILARELLDVRGRAVTRDVHEHRFIRGRRDARHRTHLRVRNLALLERVALNRDSGVTITPKTGQCQWHGESMDYSTAIEAMQFLEAKAASAAPIAPT